VRIDPDTCRDPVLLAAEVRRLQAVIDSRDASEAIDTPEPLATPDECSVPPQWTSKPYWVDPPSGHRYGFPRLYDPATDGDMRAWMVANGYPERLAQQDLPCTFTACTEDGGR
jgi:hypothetical protein